MSSTLRQYARPSFRSIEIALRESRKRLDRNRPTDALWWIYRAFVELHEADSLVRAIERDEGSCSCGVHTTDCSYLLLDFLEGPPTSCDCGAACDHCRSGPGD